MQSYGDPGNLHLMGSRITFSHRTPYSGDKKCRGRPKSALIQHTNTNEVPQKKRPLSAEIQTIGNEIFNTFTESPQRIKDKTKNFNAHYVTLNKLHSLNETYPNSFETMSDQGSEDTFVSLGTKIKSKAQQNRNSHQSNAMKSYLRCRKTVTKDIAEKNNQTDLKIFENQFLKRTNNVNAYYNGADFSDLENEQDNNINPDQVDKTFDSFFLPSNIETKSNSLAGRVSFGTPNLRNYEHRILAIQSQPLSLVEEESLSLSLSSLVHDKKKDGEDTSANDNTALNSLSLMQHNKKDSIENNFDNIETIPENNDQSNLVFDSKSNTRETSDAQNCSNSELNERFETVSSKLTDENVLRHKPASSNSIHLEEYPSYLVNNERKYYSFKVIEDYKKEIENINNLHELSLKDIQIERNSPTPLNLDEIFEESNNQIKDTDNNCESNKKTKRSKSAENDIASISTKELIQNYLKVKETPYKKSPPVKFLKKKKFIKDKLVKKVDEATNTTKHVENLSEAGDAKPSLSSRIECVQNDQDIDSWISLDETTVIVLPLREDTAKNSEDSKSLNAARDTEFSKPSSQSISVKNDETYSVSSADENKTLDLNSMLKEIESLGEVPSLVESLPSAAAPISKDSSSGDNFQEIFKFLDQVEQSANEALTVVNSVVPQTIPKFENLMQLPHTELAQRLVTAVLQLEERSCCITLLQESLVAHKEQMVTKFSAMEKQYAKNTAKVKNDAEEAIKRHQHFIDQLINDKKSLNHRIEQLVDERKQLEERWKRNAQTLEERFKIQLKNQHDRMAAAQQIAKQRWVKEKAEKIKDLTVKGLEGELREMAERQQKEVTDLKMRHTEQVVRMETKHATELEALRRRLEDEKEEAITRERQLASMRMEKQMLEIEATYQEQRSNLVKEMRAENDKATAALAMKEKEAYKNIEKWQKEQEKIIEEKKQQFKQEMAAEREKLDIMIAAEKSKCLEELERYKREFELEQQSALRRKVMEISNESKRERDKEIEKAIESMEAEAQAGRRELTDALRRNKEQYEAELRELAETEQATLRRYQDAQARIRVTEDKCADLEVLLAQADAKIKTLTDRLNNAESQLAESEKAAMGKWQEKVDEMASEIETQKTIHEQQMQQLYAKVKVAVARKDSALQAMTRENAKAQEKIIHLEQRLQQQRKDYLKQK